MGIRSNERPQILLLPKAACKNRIDRLANEALGVALEQKFLSYSFIENFVNMRKKELLMGLDNSDKDQDYRTVEHENIRNNYS